MANNKNVKKKPITKTTKKVVKEEKIEKVEEIEDIEEEEVIKEKVVKPSKNETSKNDKKIGIIAIVCVILFIILSFILPSDEPTVNVSDETVLSWSEQIDEGMVVTVLASSTCPHCQELKPVIQELSEKEGFKLYFFEIDELTSDEQTILTQTVELEDFEGSVPFVFVTYDGQLLGDTTGYADEDTLKEFLREYEVIK